MKIYAVSFLAVLLGACSYGHEREATDAVNVSGVVEKICASCSTVDLVNGGTLSWDVVTVRVTSPEDTLGKMLVIEVLLNGDGAVQRKSVYPLSSSIEFAATRAAIDAREVKLQASDITTIN